MANNDLKAWPDNWPFYKQVCFGSYRDCCDMLVGPCRCGAWHMEGEFEFRDPFLFRYGELVEIITKEEALKNLSDYELQCMGLKDEKCQS